MFICKSRILIEYLGEFLFLKCKRNGMFVLPGGKVERLDEIQTNLIQNLYNDGKDRNYDDILLNTIRREVYEELKIILPDEIDYFCSNIYINDQKNPIVEAVFYTKLLERPSIILNNNEADSCIWMTQKEVLSSEHIHEWTKKSLKIFDRID